METKIPFYNIINIFLPGLVFVGSCILLFIDETKTLVASITTLGSTGLEVLITVSCFAIAYEVGYIIFRLGVVAIEPVLMKLFGWTDYKNYTAAGKTSENAHNKLEMFSREYGHARTQITLFIVLAILASIRINWWVMVGCILCVVLFVLSTRGHMIKIQAAVEQYLAVSDNEK